MKQMKLSTQINIIFTAVSLISSLIFIFALNKVYEGDREEQNIVQLQTYFDEIAQKQYMTTTTVENLYDKYNGFAVYDENFGIYYSNFEAIDFYFEEEDIWDYYDDHWKPFSTPTRPQIKTIEDYTFIVQTENDRILIVFTGTDYITDIGNQFTVLIQISFIALIVLGNVIILTWSRLTVDRVRKLELDVNNLTKYNYQVPIKITGHDEITKLATTIEKMRREVAKSEKSKKEMLQNVGHDFKTPIAVIKSYAEAIADGISDPEEAQVIIKQVDLLNLKVKQLMEFNKLEYLKDSKEFEMVSIKDVVLSIVNNQKYRSNIKFETVLDDSKYYGIYENFQVIFSNIVDNALRYANSKIIIKLNNKVLTFYNDGEPISQKFIDSMFTPYDKGHKGQFGLGMSIVQKTCQHFNLTLSVENINNGVMFTIKPL